MLNKVYKNHRYDESVVTLGVDEFHWLVETAEEMVKQEEYEIRRIKRIKDYLEEEDNKENIKKLSQ